MTYSFSGELWDPIDSHFIKCLFEISNICESSPSGTPWTWIPLEEWQQGARKVCPPIPASLALTESPPSFIQVILATWRYPPKHGQELFVLPLKDIFRNIFFGGGGGFWESAWVVLYVPGLCRCPWTPERRHQIPYNCSHRWLWAATGLKDWTWVLCESNKSS